MSAWSEPSKGSLSVVQECDGQILVRLKLPKPRKRGGCSQGAKHRKAQDAPFLSNAANSENSSEARPGRGSLPRPKQFTQKGRDRIRKACAVLKRHFAKRIVFLTVTLPGSTSAAMEGIARYSANIVDRIKHWLDYQAPGHQWCYVWEHQKRGALHLHAAIGHSDYLKLRRIEQKLRNYVYQMYLDLSAKSGIDWFERATGESWADSPEVLRVEVKPVRKDVGRYMSKYLTKTGAGEQAYYPASWWGVSATVRRAIAAYRRSSVCLLSNWEVLKELLESIEQQLERIAGYRVSWRSYESPEERSHSIYPAETETTPWFEVLALIVDEGCRLERATTYGIKLKPAWSLVFSRSIPDVLVRVE